MRLLVAGLVAASLAALAPRPATAESHACLRALDELGVEYRRVERPGIALAVEVRGAIGGVEYRPYLERPLVLDCSLVYSLARAGRWLVEHGVERAIYSSSYQRRNVRGSSSRSKHSFGLAIDLHSFVGDGQELHLRDHYEQGLGDDVDCVGAPLTEEGRRLRTLACQLERSELFSLLLGPDDDAHHYNHFHLEALPWSERR